MKYIFQRLKRFCGFVTGFVFFISGVLKLLDPVGTGLVMKEYFDFLHIGFLGPISKPLGTLFAFAEVTIGTALVTGVWRKVAAIAAMAFQGFFTILTLLLVIFQPEMDCGCFGEAIHLTHWQTFIKNIVLCILLGAYSFPFSSLGGPKARKYVSFGSVMVSMAAFTVYSWAYIPPVDFTEFRSAAALQAGSAFPAAEEDAYEAVFIYEKDGNEEIFCLDNIPDSTWTFVRTETTPKARQHEGVVSLSFYDTGGDYHDEAATERNVMVFSVYDIDSGKKKWERIAKNAATAAEAGFRPIILSAGTAADTEEVLSKMAEDKAEFIRSNLYYSDYKTLITLNRSNGGATWFSDGYLIRKWATIAFPTKEELTELTKGDATEILLGRATNGELMLQGFLLYVSAVMLLL